MQTDLAVQQMKLHKVDGFERPASQRNASDKSDHQDIKTSKLKTRHIDHRTSKQRLPEKSSQRIFLYLASSTDAQAEL